MKKNENLQALKDANRECKTLSGACKIARTFWANGYKQAFSGFGVTYDMLANVPAIIALCQKDSQGEIFVTKKVRILDENKQPVLSADGRTYKKVLKDVPVKNWSPNILFKVLEQSTNK